MVQVGRGMPAHKEAIFKYMTEKEATMKLKWYYKNQQKLIDEAKIQLARKGLSPEVLAEVEEMRKERYSQMQRFAKKKAEELPFPDIDPHSILNVMKPVDPEVTKILYTPKDIEGTTKYLNKRYELLPDERFYFPETTSFDYGWHVYENMRNTPEQKRFGKQQIVQTSFYRRNGGLVRDREYNRSPQQTSPSVCGCI